MYFLPHAYKTEPFRLAAKTITVLNYYFTPKTDNGKGGSFYNGFLTCVFYGEAFLVFLNILFVLFL